MGRGALREGVKGKRCSGGIVPAHRPLTLSPISLPSASGLIPPFAPRRLHWNKLFPQAHSTTAARWHKRRLSLHWLKEFLAAQNKTDLSISLIQTPNITYEVARVYMMIVRSWKQALRYYILNCLLMFNVFRSIWNSFGNVQIFVGVIGLRTVAINWTERNLFRLSTS